MSADDEPRRIADTVKALEQEDLDSYSLHEMDERIERLEAEILRVKALKNKKIAGAAAAQALFGGKS